MSKRTDIDIVSSAEHFDSGERMPIDRVEIGQWFWVKVTVQWDDESKGRKKGDTYELFCCVTKVGSNFVELKEPPSNGTQSVFRVHFDDFEQSLRFEPDHDSVIANNVNFYKSRVSQLMGEVQELTQSLGMTPTGREIDHERDAKNALVAVTSVMDVNGYKNALIKAKEETLPSLFKEIEKANSGLASWLTAPTMSVVAALGPMKETLHQVEDRIHTLGLYAGFSEDAVQIRDGKPADRHEKLRIMQRRMYMDEECLVAYEAGGMEMKHIGEFDEWLSRPKNFKRLLPFERCATAFRVRRERKERNANSLWEAFVNLQIGKGDIATFLYIRNGEQLWRIDCEFDFGEKIVPDMTEFDPSQPMMVKMFGSRVDKIIPLSQWETMRDDYHEAKRKRDEWRKAHPDEKHCRICFMLPTNGPNIVHSILRTSIMMKP